MGVLSGKVTLLDLANVKDPNGDLSSIAEVLTEDNEILLDAPWGEANDTFSNRSVRDSKLPTGSWRQVNAGVDEEKGTTKAIVDSLGMLDTISEIDVELVRAAPSPEGFLMQQRRRFLEGMSQTLATTFIYGDSSLDVEKFTGFAPRMASLVTGGRVVGAGGTGSTTTSIYAVQWGLDKVWMAYPKGSSLGIEHDDRGIDLTTDSNSKKFRAYIDYFSLKGGLVVADDRCIGRLANIASTGSSNLFDVDKIIEMTNRMPRRGNSAALYMNDTVLSQIEIQAKDKQNVYYGPEDAFGRPVTMLRTHPLRMVDKITNTETAIT
jgi:hypothetical protein